ncbi:MAG: carboxypeptidase regulatory-like domain-containing protein [Acidobacteriota bacterium]
MNIFRAAAAAALLTATAFAQIDTGTITGVVRDTTAAIIAGAQVTIANEGTGQKKLLTTNDSGIYFSGPLRPGTYRVDVEAKGFNRVAKRLPLDVNEHASIDFQIELGSVTENITVTDEVPLLQTESATLSDVRSERAVKDLPLNGRNFTQLIQLSAGAVPAMSQTGGLQVVQKRGVPNISINGSGHWQNNILIEGISNMENHNGNGILIYPSIDAIQEFRVESSVADVQSGRGGGGTINLVYKSGTKDYHGGAYWFLRNSTFDAKNFFDRPGDPIPPFKMNQFGAFLGGPVIPKKDPKTFFFFNYEGNRVRQAQTYISTVPKAAFRTGDFSSYSRRLYDPLTQRPNGASFIRDQFPGNIIPANRLDQVGKNLLNLYPQPNLGSGEANNFLLNPLRPNDGDRVDFKVDQIVSDTDTFFVRFSRGNDTLVEPSLLGYPAVGGGPGVPGTAKQPVTQLVASETHLFSPTVINEFRAGWTRLNLQQLPLTFGQNLTSDLGFPGANDPGDPFTSGLAIFNIATVTSLGDSGFSPAIVVSDNIQFGDTVNINRGKHSFKFGGELQRRRYNALQSNTFRGSMSITGGYTQDPANASGSGSGMADALLGKAISGSIRFLRGTRGYRRSEYSGFTQDVWRATNKLSVTLGLRYDNFGGGPWTEVNNRMYQFVPELQTVVQVGTNGLSRSGINGDNNNISPRIGLAYRLNSKTVLRAAGGIFYSPLLSDVTRNIGANPPEFVSYQYNNNQFDFVNARPLSAGLERPAQGTITGNLTALDFSTRTPYNTQWNLAVQRELPGGTSLTMAYVGNKGTKLQGFPDINQALPGTTAVATRRPFPAFGTINSKMTRYNSIYNALQITAERRFAKGFAFQGSYTYSHSIDDNGATDANAGGLMVRNTRLDRSNSDINIPHRVVANWSYQLPIKMEGWKDTAFGNWQLNGILTLSDGIPFDLSSPNTTNCCGSRPDRIGLGILSDSDQSIRRWFDTSAFKEPGLLQFGNAGRNILQGPGTKQLDFSLFKKFPFGEARRLEFRAEFFNLFNTPQFNNPNGTLGSAAFGTITSAGSPISFQRTSRQVQFGLKFYF